jgi:hypothetical protein
MRNIGVLIPSSCPATGLLARPAGIKQTAIETVGLYSWKNALGVWNFGLLPAITDSGLSPQLITNKTRLLANSEKLKEKIATLPSGWLNGTLGIYTKVSDTLLERWLEKLSVIVTRTGSNFLKQGTNRTGLIWQSL